MNEYNAIATREGDLWVVEFPGIGATQGVDRDDAMHMARDYIATLHEVPIEDVSVTITWREGIDPAEVRARMINAAMEIIWRDSGYPSVADMDRDMPVWRQQCEEIVSVILDPTLAELEELGHEHVRLRQDLAAIYEWAREHLGLHRDASTLDVVRLIKRMEQDSEAYRQLLECANPDLTAAVARAITLNVNAGSTVNGMARAAIQAVFRHYETAYVDEDHQGSNLLALYIELWQEFNLLNARRCLRYTCDHLETHHTDTGCDRCSCSELTRTPTR